VLENCELRDLGAGGVKIGEGRFVRGKTEMTRRCAVKNCLISEGGRVNPAGVGVWIGHAKENLVSRNTIRDLYYSGVSAGWNWSFNETARDNIIEWNHICDIGRGVLSDMGGIYLLGSQPGTVERFNYIHDVTRARNCAFGIYFDSGTSHVVVSNNVVHDCQDSNFFLAAISASNRVVNNIFAFGPGRQLHAAGRNPKSSPTRFERNVVAWDEGAWADGLPGEEAISLSGNLYLAPEESRPKNAPRGGVYVDSFFADICRAAEDQLPFSFCILFIQKQVRLCASLIPDKDQLVHIAFLLVFFLQHFPVGMGDCDSLAFAPFGADLLTVLFPDASDFDRVFLPAVQLGQCRRIHNSDFDDRFFFVFLLEIDLISYGIFDREPAEEDRPISRLHR
jgi:hypothetical protein